MIGPLQRQPSLFGFAFFKELVSLEDPTLSEIDLLLDDSALVAICSRALAARRQRSINFGRSTIAPDPLLRCVVLKHLKGWSFRGLEEELRANLLYRRFTRFYEDPIPDHTVFSRLFRSVGNRRAAGSSCTGSRQGQSAFGCQGSLLAHGHDRGGDQHPPSQRQFAFGRLAARADALAPKDQPKLSARGREGGRSCPRHQYRLLEIARAARLLNEAGQQRMKKSYGRLLRLTRTVTSGAHR